jgi:hypothetical protein
MPRLELRLRVDPATGRRSVEIGYRSDADALPMEHEAAHRALLERLLGSAADARAIERVGGTQGTTTSASGEDVAQGKREKA